MKKENAVDPLWDWDGGACAVMAKRSTDIYAPASKRFIALFTSLVFAWTMICPMGFAETVNLEGGSVDVNVQDNVTNWNVTGNPVWNVPEFNVAQGSIYNIAGLGSGSSLALLVNGGSASNIFGTMNLSNLNFILQNIAGINIGSSAMINLNSASLIASTLPLNLNMTDFLKRDYQFSGQGGFLSNEGRISGTNADLVAFVANAMENKGVIEVPMGTVALAAGNTVTVGISGDGLVSIGVDEATANDLGLSDQIKNTGTITADGGKVMLTAKAIDGLFDKAINIQKDANAITAVRANNGAIEFKSLDDIYNDALIEAMNGQIKMTSEKGAITNAGTVDATKGSIEMNAAGDIETKGILRAKTFDEKGASFGIGGIYEVGLSRHENVDKAITYEANTILGGTITDLENIIINEGVLITLSGNTIFTADSDQNATGSFTMLEGSRINAGGFGLSISSSGTMTVRDVTNAGTFAAYAELTDIDNIRLLGDVSASNIYAYAYGDIEVAGILAGQLRIFLQSDSNNTNLGSLTAGVETDLQSGASGSIRIVSPSSIRLSDWIDEGEVFKDLYVSTLGAAGSEGNIIMDRSIDKSVVSESSLTFSSKGNIELTEDVSLKAASYVFLYADSNMNSTGSLIRNGHTVDVESGISGAIQFTSASDIRLSDWIDSETIFRNLSVSTTGVAGSEGDIIIDCSIDKSGTSGSTLSFQSYGDIQFAEGLSLKAATGVALFADKNTNGAGSLTRDGGLVDVVVGASGQIDLTSASDIRISDWIGEAEAFKYLSVSTTGIPGSEGDILMDRSIDKSEVSNSSLSFRPYGNIEFTEDVSLKAALTLYLQADNNSNGEGSLIRNGHTVDVGMGSTGSIVLKSASDIRISDWIDVDEVFKNLTVYTTGTADSEGDIIMDRSIDKSGVSSSDLSFYAYGDIEFTGDISLKAASWLNLSADSFPSDGAGSLMKNGHTIDIGVGSGGTIGLRSASDIRLSDWIDEGEAFKSLSVSTTGTTGSEGNIIMDRSIDKSEVNKSKLYFVSYGDIEFENDLSLKAVSQLDLAADNNGDGAGSLIKNGHSIDIGVSSGGGIGLSAPDIRLSDWIDVGEVFGSLSVWTTGTAGSEGDIIIDRSINKLGLSYSSLYFYADGDIEFADNISLKADYYLYLSADSDLNGEGSLVRNGGLVDIEMGPEGTIALKSASDIRLSDWVDEGEVFRALSIYTTGTTGSEGNIIIDRSLDKSGVHGGAGLGFCSYGDIEFSKDLSLKASTLTFKADWNQDGAGTLKNSGGYQLTFDASSIGTISLMSGQDLRVSDWLQDIAKGGDDVFNSYNASAGDDLFVDVDNIGGFYVSLIADHDNNGLGTVYLSADVIAKSALRITNLDSNAIDKVLQDNPALQLLQKNITEDGKITLGLVSEEQKQLEEAQRRMKERLNEPAEERLRDFNARGDFQRFFTPDIAMNFRTDVRVQEGAVYVVDGGNDMSLLTQGESVRVDFKEKKAELDRSEANVPGAKLVEPAPASPAVIITPSVHQPESGGEAKVLSGEYKSATPVVMERMEKGGRYGVLKNPGKDVFVKCKGGDWQAAKDGMTILPGDVVKTAASGSVEVMLDGGKVGRVEIKEGSLFRINKAETDPVTGDKTTLLDLAIGKVLVHAGKLQGKSRFEVKTPTVLTGVRGTVFEVIVKEKGNM